MASLRCAAAAAGGDTNARGCSFRRPIPAGCGMRVGGVVVALILLMTAVRGAGAREARPPRDHRGRNAARRGDPSSKSPRDSSDARVGIKVTSAG